MTATTFHGQAVAAMKAAAEHLQIVRAAGMDPAVVRAARLEYRAATALVDEAHARMEVDRAVEALTRAAATRSVADAAARDARAAADDVELDAMPAGLAPITTAVDTIA